jgi:hypothetical protein
MKIRVLLFCSLTVAAPVFAGTSTCVPPTDAEQPSAVFEKVDDSAWKRVSQPSEDAEGDVITIARVYEDKTHPRVTMSSSVAGDISDFSLYCFGSNEVIETFRFEATTAWGWTYTRDIDYRTGKKTTDRERFFDAKTNRALKKEEQQTWIREHVEEYSSLSQMPFFQPKQKSSRLKDSNAPSH